MELKRTSPIAFYVLVTDVNIIYNVNRGDE